MVGEQDRVFHLVSFNTLLGMAGQDKPLINPFTNRVITERKQVLTGQELLDWFDQAERVKTSSELTREALYPIKNYLVPSDLFGSEESEQSASDDAPVLQLIPQQTMTFGKQASLQGLSLSSAESAADVESPTLYLPNYQHNL